MRSLALVIGAVLPSGMPALPAGSLRAAGSLGSEGAADVADAIVRTRTGEVIPTELVVRGGIAGDRAEAERAGAAVVDLIHRLGTAGVVRASELSLTLAALGQRIPRIGAELSAEQAARIAEAARGVGAQVTLRITRWDPVDLSLETLARLRAQFPDLGVELDAGLTRTEQDARDLAYEGSRVRIVADGSTDGPPGQVYRDRARQNQAAVRALRQLLRGRADAQLASDDPTLQRVAGALGSCAEEPTPVAFHISERAPGWSRLVEAGETVWLRRPWFLHPDAPSARDPHCDSGSSGEERRVDLLLDPWRGRLAAATRRLRFFPQRELPEESGGRAAEETR